MGPPSSYASSLLQPYALPWVAGAIAAFGVALAPVTKAAGRLAGSPRLGWPRAIAVTALVLLLWFAALMAAELALDHALPWAREGVAAAVAAAVAPFVVRPLLPRTDGRRASWRRLVAPLAAGPIVLLVVVPLLMQLVRGDG